MEIGFGIEDRKSTVALTTDYQRNKVACYNNLI